MPIFGPLLGVAGGGGGGGGGRGKFYSVENHMQGWGNTSTGA